MSIEEAIAFFKDMIECTYENLEEVEMAIKALEQEPCEDAISRQAVDDAIYDYSRSCDVNYAKIMEFIDKLPSVSPQPKVGQWIFHKPFDIGHKNCNECIECSQCHTWLGYDCYAKTPYCPFCGANMSEIPTGAEGSEE